MQNINDQSAHSVSEHGQAASKRHPMQWWFRLTSIPDSPENASFQRQERVRRSHVISLIAFFVIVISLILAPFALEVGSNAAPFFVVDLSALPIALLIILLNRFNKVITAGLLFLLVFEAALSAYFYIFPLTSEAALLEYEVFILVELVAVSILPPKTVFLVFAYNVAFFVFSLFYMVHSAAIDHDLQVQQLLIIVCFSVVQFLVALGLYLWVAHTARALTSADRTELVAVLEQRLAQQTAQAAAEKQHIEDSINYVAQLYVKAATNHATVTVPFTEDTREIWPLINVLGSLQRRSNVLLKNEQELQSLKAIISHYTSAFLVKRILWWQPWPQTKTDLDALLYAIKQNMADPQNAQIPFSTEASAQANSRYFPAYQQQFPANTQSFIEASAQANSRKFPAYQQQLPTNTQSFTEASTQANSRKFPAYQQQLPTNTQSFTEASTQANSRKFPAYQQQLPTNTQSFTEASAQANSRKFPAYQQQLPTNTQSFTEASTQSNSRKFPAYQQQLPANTQSFMEASTQSNSRKFPAYQQQLPANTQPSMIQNANYLPGQQSFSGVDNRPLPNQLPYLHRVSGVYQNPFPAGVQNPTVQNPNNHVSQQNLPAMDGSALYNQPSAIAGPTAVNPLLDGQGLWDIQLPPLDVDPSTFSTKAKSE